MIIAIVKNPGTEEFIGVEYLDRQYSPTTVYTQDHADALNKRQGITAEIADAFLMGSMFGWEVPGAKLARDYAAARSRADAKQAPTMEECVAMTLPTKA